MYYNTFKQLANDHPMEPKEPIPIFIISHDRLKVLRESILSFKQIGTPYQVIIHDNNSTYRPTLEYLKSLEDKDNFTVVYNKTNDLNSVSVTIKTFMATSNCQYYVVSDPDIALFNVDADILEVYQHFLDSNPRIIAAGPMLEIKDIPDYYPLKALAIQRHTDQFWHKEPVPYQWQGKEIHYQSAHIDTTFAMYRRSFTFKNYNIGVRLYQPYSARHLDWYIDPDNMSADQKYYLANASAVSHWGGDWLKSYVDKKG